MFVGTFVVLPVLKAHLDHQQRHKFIVKFIPRVRRIVRVFIVLLVLSGVTRLHYMAIGGGWLAFRCAIILGRVS